MQKSGAGSAVLSTWSYSRSAGNAAPQLARSARGPRHAGLEDEWSGAAHAIVPSRVCTRLRPDAKTRDWPPVLVVGLMRPEMLHPTGSFYGVQKSPKMGRVQAKLIAS